MLSSTLFAGVFALLSLGASGIPYEKRAGVAFFAPIDGGGSELDVAGVGVGEPMNVRFFATHDRSLLLITDK